MVIKIGLVLLILFFLFSPSISYAHPGRTDSSGCHTCRTNCSDWGLDYGDYHCHGGEYGTPYSTPYTTPYTTPYVTPYSAPATPQLDSQDDTKEVDRLVSEVSKLIELPKGETPSLATVTDVNLLKDQPFFQNAKNGDKVLIYQISKKAILYDPIAKKVIDVTTVNMGDLATPTPASSSTPAPLAKSEVLGTENKKGGENTWVGWIILGIFIVGLYLGFKKIKGIFSKNTEDNKEI